MPKTRQLAELFRAIATEDIGSARHLATEICKTEENSGHRNAARLLRGALHANGSAAPRNRESIAEAAGIVSAALVRLPDNKTLSDVALSPQNRKDLEAFVSEWRQRALLMEYGIAARSKLLFHGPPGCGKSLTAQALGRELQLPVYMVRFDAVIGAFLGQTAIHLRQLFHFAETTPCVLLLDELDALGKKRGNPLDVGELDRIVISLLQELEHARPIGVIIGTSNLPRHLDDALWRRFDLDMRFKAPTKTALRKFIGTVADRSQVSLPAVVVAAAMKTSSFAAAEAVVIAEVRRQILRRV